MLRIFPYIFLVIMTLFTVVPTIDQVWGRQVCKIATVNNGMAEEEVKVHQEHPHFFSYELNHAGDFDTERDEKASFFFDDLRISQLFVLRPEMPPDA